MAAESQLHEERPNRLEAGAPGFFHCLRNRITIPFALLTLLVAASGTFMAVRFIGVSLEDRLTGYTADALGVAKEGVVELQEERLAALRAMAYTEGVSEAIAIQDGRRLAELLTPLKMNHGLEAVEVFDVAARELVSIQHDPGSRRAEDFALSQGRDLSSWPIVHRILAGEVDGIGDKQVEMRDNANGQLLWLGAPVRDARGAVVGGILVGTGMDRLAHSLTEKALARVSVYDLDGHCTASALFDDPAGMGVEAEMLSRLAGKGDSACLAPLEWEGRAYLMGYAPLVVRGQEMGVLSVAVSTDYIAETSDSAQTGMVLLFSAAGLAVLLLGVVIAGQITTPLRNLVLTSRQIAGGDFARRVERIGKDEIGQLARAFNFMAGELAKHTDQLNRRIAELSTLHETSTRLNSTLDLAEILRVAVDALYESGHASLVMLLLIREVSRDWVLAAARGPGDAEPGGMVGTPIKALPDGLKAKHEGGAFTIDDRSEIGAVMENLGLAADVGSLMVVPLTAPDHMVGLVLLGRPEGSGFSDEAQLSLLQTMSSQISQAVRNARLHQEVTENVFRLASLNRASRSISDKLSRQEVLERTLASIEETARGGLITVHLLDPSSGRPVLAASNRAGRGARLLTVGHQLAEDAIAERTAFTVVHGKPTPVEAGDNDVELGRILCAPMTAEDQVLGAISLTLTDSEEGFLAADLVVLTTVADQAAVAMKNALLYQDIADLYHNVVRSLAVAIDARDPYTHGHSHRVAANALVLAGRLGLDGAQRKSLEVGAYLHDIGKIGVRDSILLKRAPLSAGERRAIEEHPAVGARILEPVGFEEGVISVVLCHHERLDGRGYPSGLEGFAIPIGARILCVADAFDAMLSDRPYRSALPLEEAVAELRSKAGTQFDPTVVEELLSALAEGSIILAGRLGVDSGTAEAVTRLVTAG